MAARTPLKRDWIEYEATVRCPQVNGRRNGLSRARLDLNREWAAMSAANRTICGETLRAARAGLAAFPALGDDAVAARTRATTTRDLRDSNALSARYFAECRIALGLAVQCRAVYGEADRDWTTLRSVYMLVPEANRTTGQIASINAATQRIADARANRTTWNNRALTINRWIQTDPIYVSPGRGPAFRVREDHVPKERRPRANGTLQRNFGAEGVPGEWRSVPAARLAEEGNNALRVWFQVDENGRIQKRLVRKTQDVADLYNSNIMKGVLPWELECHRIVNDIQDRDDLRYDSFVQLRTTDQAHLARWVNRIGRPKRYHVYMDWYPGGDLNKLMADHRALALNATTPSTPIPEPMIWNIAESLIRSGQRMGPRDQTREGQQILHRDLKPANVFLGDPQTRYYSDYPSVLLSDFGHAIMTSANDERNPEWYSGRGGTRGFKAPEMMRFVDPTTLHPVEVKPLLEKTNVWQVGAILRCLVLLESAPEESLFLDGDNDVTYTVNVPGSPAAATYSDELLLMIDHMMKYEPDARPSFDNLAAMFGDDYEDVSQGMREGTTPAALRATFQLAIPATVDAYAVDMAAPA